jgi:corrinoid protein of di/trimethylamine methyltransferase
MADLEQFCQDVRKAIVDGDRDAARELAREAVRRELDLNAVIDTGFIPGIQVVGELWEKGEYFLPELIAGAECMKAAMEVLRPEMARTSVRSRSLGKVVIGTVEGDIHDIGKNLVASMLQANGFEVFDLGADVKPEAFIARAEAVGADIICLSALLTTTMLNQRRFIEILRGRGLDGKYKVMVGGAPADRKWADGIGAQGYAENAPLAVKAAIALMGKRA